MTDNASDQQPIASPGIDFLLQGLQQRLRRRYLVHGLGLSLLLPMAAIILFFLLDHTLRLPLLVRSFHTLLIAALLVAAVLRFVRYPLSRRFAVTDLANLVEARFPALQQRLVSAVQLAALPAAGQALRNQSPAMIANLLQQARAEATNLPLAQLFDARRTRRVLLGAVAALGSLLAIAATSPATAWAFLLRHLGQEASYPRATHLQIEVPPAGPDLQRRDLDDSIELLLPAGTDLHVSVLATGLVPAEVSLVITPLPQAGSGAGAAEPRSVLMAPRPGDRFRHVFRRVNQSFRFHARGGDDEFGDKLVIVRTVQPPQVAGLATTITPPAYTCLPAVRQESGAVEALIGSQVSVELRTTAAVREATLVMLERGDRILLQPLELLDDGGTATSFRGSFTVTVADRYQLELLAPNELRNLSPGSYPVLALQDFAPVGRWLLPEEETTLLLPTALLCLRSEFRDDYGLAAATLVIEQAEGELARRELLPAAAAGTAATADSPRLQFLQTELIEIQELLAQTSGRIDSLALSIALRDHRQPEPNATELPRRIVQLVEQAQLAEQVAKLFRTLREEVQQAFDLQTDRQARLSNLLQAPPDSALERQGLLAGIEVGQSRVQGSSERLTRGLMRAFDLHLWNRLEPSPNAAVVIELYRNHSAQAAAVAHDPAFYRDLLQRRNSGSLGAMETVLDPILQMIGLADRLANEDAPQATRLLAAAQVARAGPEQRQLLENAATMQERIRQTLQNLLLRLADWHDFQDLVQEARALRDRQLDLQTRTEEARGK